MFLSLTFSNSQYLDMGVLNVYPNEWVVGILLKGLWSVKSQLKDGFRIGKILAAMADGISWLGIMKESCRLNINAI